MTRRKKKQKSPTPAPKAAPTPAKKPRYERVRPWLLGGATALFVARPLFASESAAAGDGISVVMAWILLGAIGFFEARRQDGPVFRWTRADLFFAAFLAWTAVSGLYWAAEAHARPAVNMVWQWIGFGFGFFLIRQFLASARERRALIAVMIALAVGLSCYGLYQVAVELPQTQAKYRANPEKTLRDAGLYFPAGSPQRQLYESRLNDLAPLGTFALTNSLAGFFAPWFIVLAGICGGMFAGERLRQLWWRGAMCLVPMVVCLWWTHSRTGVGAVLIGVGTLILYAQRKRISRKHILVAATIVAVSGAAIAGVAAVRTRILDGAAKSLGYRLEYWYSSGLLIADSPILGCGPGGFQSAYTAYKLPRASEEVADPHNFLVEVAATTGIPGLLLFVALLVSIGTEVWRRQSDEPDSDGLPEAVFLGAIGGALLSLPLALMCVAPAGWMSLVVVIPAAVLACWLLLPWVSKGECSPRLLLLGALVLLVNLLAAGGIGFPGVAGSLWLLAGAALWRSEGSRTLSRTAATIGFGVCCLLVVLCYLSAYKPNLDRRTHTERAMRMMYDDGLTPATREAVVESLRKAAEADPLSAEPWQQLAGAYGDWPTSAEDWRRFEEATAKAIEKDPRSAGFYAATGQCYLAPKWGDPKKAAQALERAIELYPNNATYRGHLALAYDGAGREADARREAEIALHLDEITPHKDKKLPEELRLQLRKWGRQADDAKSGLN